MVDGYAAHAQEFIATTIDLDMSEFHDEFLSYVPHRGLILDIGSGSGRDAKAFDALGYRVQMLEPSGTLRQHLATYVGQEAIGRTIQDFDPPRETYDGVWANASLLHLPPEDLPLVFFKIFTMLRSQGIFYASFKYGNLEIREKHGLQYLYMNEEYLDKLLPLGDLFECCRVWITDDNRTDRPGEQWLNCLLRRP